MVTGTAPSSRRADVPDLTIHRHSAALTRKTARLMALPGVVGAVALTRHRYRARIVAAVQG